MCVCVGVVFVSFVFVCAYVYVSLCFRWDQTVSPALLRLSIGLESPEDLIADLEQARTISGLCWVIGCWMSTEYLATCVSEFSLHRHQAIKATEAELGKDDAKKDKKEKNEKDKKEKKEKKDKK